MPQIDWEEAFEYLPGLIVELKSRPGVFDTIAAYDLTMVPPIWLEKDSRPRYPHELQIISRERVQACQLVVPQATNLERQECCL